MVRHSEMHSVLHRLRIVARGAVLPPCHAVGSTRAAWRKEEVVMRQLRTITEGFFLISFAAAVLFCTVGVIQTLPLRETILF